ncbi:hypothetical protein ACXZ65_34305 [Streptomyces aculeolatus]
MPEGTGGTTLRKTPPAPPASSSRTTAAPKPKTRFPLYAAAFAELLLVLIASVLALVLALANAGGHAVRTAAAGYADRNGVEPPFPGVRDRVAELLVVGPAGKAGAA